MSRKTCFIIILALVAASPIRATVLTVNNNTPSPGQYSNLQAAIDAAGLNDTIMVAGSPTSYGDVSFAKPLVLVGAGHNNPYGHSTILGTMNLTRENLYLSASGSHIMGFQISYLNLKGYYASGADTTRTIDNVVIERCKVEYLTFYNENYKRNSYNNNTIQNCLITSRLYFQDSHTLPNTINNLYINNCVFSSPSSTGINYFYGHYYDGNITDLATCYVRNNLFFNHTTNCFEACKNAVVENNIFYGAEPHGGTTIVYNNNITYMCVNNSLPGSGNLGSGNMVNVDPQFVSIPLAGGNYSYTWDVHLKPTSAGKNAGTDGTDIGLYGGPSPADPGANPAFPQMMEISFPNGSSAPAGGTLDVFFKARKQN